MNWFCHQVMVQVRSVGEDTDGAATAPAVGTGVTINAYIEPKTAGEIYQNYGVETRGGGVLFAKLSDLSVLDQPRLLLGWNDRHYQTIGRPIVRKDDRGLDHIECVIEEMEAIS